MSLLCIYVYDIRHCKLENTPSSSHEPQCHVTPLSKTRLTFSLIVSGWPEWPLVYKHSHSKTSRPDIGTSSSFPLIWYGDTSRLLAIMKIYKLALTSALCASTPTILCSQAINVSNEIRLGNSIAQFVSGASGLDGPKMDPEINATSFDWWYFDAVSENSCAVVIVFCVTTDLGFPFVPPLSTLSVDIFATFEDGTLVFLPLNDLPLRAGTATVVTGVDGSSGSWEGIGFEWKGAPDLSQYVVTIDSPLLGITGTLH